MTRLAVHAEGEQMLSFNPNSDIQKEISTAHSTTLVALMDHNTHNIDGLHLLYYEFPRYYVFRTSDQGAYQWYKK